MKRYLIGKLSNTGQIEFYGKAVEKYLEGIQKVPNHTRTFDLNDIARAGYKVVMKLEGNEVLLEKDV